MVPKVSKAGVQPGEEASRPSGQLVGQLQIASAVLLLAFKNERKIVPDLLIDKPRNYNLEERVGNFISYVKSNGKTESSR